MKETFSPLLVLMILIYPTLIGFLFAARLAMFVRLIPTPTVPGVPPSDVGSLHGAHDLWDTKSAGTSLAFASIIVVHLVIFFHMFVRASHGASCDVEPVYIIHLGCIDGFMVDHNVLFHDIH